MGYKVIYSRHESTRRSKLLSRSSRLIAGVHLLPKSRTFHPLFRGQDTQTRKPHVAVVPCEGPRPIYQLRAFILRENSPRLEINITKLAFIFQNIPGQYLTRIGLCGILPNLWSQKVYTSKIALLFHIHSTPSGYLHSLFFEDFFSAIEFQSKPRYVLCMSLKSVEYNFLTQVELIF